MKRKLQNCKKMLQDAATKDEKIEDLQLTILVLHGLLTFETRINILGDIQPAFPIKNIIEANVDGQIDKVQQNMNIQLNLSVGSSGK
jgi:hypothetical protein